MKRHIVSGMVFIFSLIVLLLTSCEAANLKKAIIGKWFRESGEGQLEFLKDGTVIMDSSPGDYRFIDDNRIRLDFKGMGGQAAIVLEVSIDKEGKLILKEPNGEAERFLTEKAKLAQKEKRKKALVFSDLTVMDKETKLMWTRDGNIAGKKMYWEDAFKFIRQLNEQKYAGYSDWRLPTKEELETLLNFAKIQGYEKKLDELFNKIGFKNVQSDYYWSSTTGADDTSSAWVVDMWGGYVDGVSKDSGSYVWPVRSGQ